MNKQMRALLVFIAFLLGLVGLISIYFSTWALRKPGATFAEVGIWFPLGIFAIFVATILGLSAATSSIKE